MKLGSLFDGSGGFPLAGSMFGIEPRFASEIEPYPIAVTTSRFPKMKHFGDVSKLNGAEIEPVDVITFGSPCQDLSVAGKRAGLKHEDNGDEETTRSGLFVEAIRIIKEMREATNGVYPRFAVWENVPGAFSSNKCEDFRVVLEEFVKVIEPKAEMPPMPKGGWAYADVIVGDGWSIAYRTYDAQYWGVPQRRRRIYLVADFGGECAAEISFKCEGLRGYFEKGISPWKRTSAVAQDGIGADDSKGTCVTEVGFDAYQHHGWRQSEKSGTLTAGQNDSIRGDTPLVVTYDARGNGDGKTVNTITGDHENRVTDYTSVVCIQDSTENKKQNGRGWCEDTSYTLNTIDRPAVAYQESVGALCARDYKGVGSQYVDEDKCVVAYGFYPQMKAECVTWTEELAGCLVNGTNPGFHNGVCVAAESQYIVRRLTPTECARLQGFPDKWGHPDKKTEFTDEEYAFWLDVRKTDAEINGKQIKEWTREQMLTWYNKLHTDSSEYKMWGNGIALPNALYVMQGIAEVLRRENNGEDQ